MKKKVILGLAEASILSIVALGTVLSGSKISSSKNSEDLGTSSFTLNTLSTFSGDEGEYVDVSTCEGFDVKVLYYLNGCESITWNGAGRFFDCVTSTSTMYDRGVGIWIKAYGVTAVRVHSSRSGVQVYRTANYWSEVTETKVTTTTPEETVTFDAYEDNGYGGVYIDCPLVETGDRTFSLYSIEVIYSKSVCADILANL